MLAFDYMEAVNNRNEQKSEIQKSERRGSFGLFKISISHVRTQRLEHKTRKEVIHTCSHCSLPQFIYVNVFISPGFQFKFGMS